MLVAFHKPYGVLSQFTSDGSSYGTLKQFHFPPSIYPIGRLDAESEGLLLLSDEPDWNARLLHPDRHIEKTYWALVERKPSEEALERLRRGVLIEGIATRPAQANILEPQPNIPPRDPPVRYRKNVQDYWLELKIVEGRNRQVRKMTAAVGHPTLRLIRMAIGGLTLGNLPAGKSFELDAQQKKLVYSRGSPSFG